MMIRGICILLVGGALAVSPLTASAQILQPGGPVDYDHNMQPFAPVELNFDNQPNQVGDGFFFSYEKLHWAATGERVTVGDPNVTREIHPVWYDHTPSPDPVTGLPTPAGLPVDPITGQPINPDTGDVINRPFFVNSLQSSIPRAVFGWGDRYEFGYWEEDTGWIFTIIDWEQTQSQAFGTNGGSQEGQGGLQSPLGDVYVAFNYEPGFMHGFLDIRNDFGSDDGRILPDDTDGDGILDGDGWADDIDEDAHHGPDNYDLQTPGDIPDTDLDNPPDYDDLVELPTAFRTLVLINRVEVIGIELMKSHRLNNNHYLKTRQNNSLFLSYGARFLQFSDQFIFLGNGGVLGETQIDMKIDNNIVGPQVGLRWENEHGHWRTDVDGRCTLGYNVSNWKQEGFIGEDLTPGRHNHPLYLQAHSFSYGLQDEDFSPIVELRLGVSYKVSQSLALKLGYTGIFINNIHRAAEHINYNIPNVGISREGEEHVIINGVNAGLEFKQ